MRITIFAFILSVTLLLTSSAMAIRPWGDINKTYKYNYLKIEDSGGGTCLISGEIINKTNKLKDGVWVKIYGFDIFNSFLWSKILFFSTIPARGKIPFAERIFNCSKSNPYKLKFKVIE